PGPADARPRGPCARSRVVLAGAHGRPLRRPVRVSSGLGRERLRDALGGELGALDEARKRAEATFRREAYERELRHARAERPVQHRPAVADLDTRAQLRGEHREPVAAEGETAGDDARVDL